MIKKAAKKKAPAKKSENEKGLATTPVTPRPRGDQPEESKAPADNE